MNLVEPIRRSTPGHSQVVPGGSQITLRRSSDTLGGVVFKKLEREVEKSG